MTIRTTPTPGARLVAHNDALRRQVPTIILSDRRPPEVREIEKRGLLSLGRPFELADLLALLGKALPAAIPQSVLGCPPCYQARTPAGET